MPTCKVRDYLREAIAMTAGVAARADLSHNTGVERHESPSSSTAMRVTDEISSLKRSHQLVHWQTLVDVVPLIFMIATYPHIP